jgi:hypothetical protein
MSLQLLLLQLLLLQLQSLLPLLLLLVDCFTLTNLYCGCNCTAAMLTGVDTVRTTAALAATHTNLTVLS